jgi:hypothetical protein
VRDRDWTKKNQYQSSFDGMKFVFVFFATSEIRIETTITDAE